METLAPNDPHGNAIVWLDSDFHLGNGICSLSWVNSKLRINVALYSGIASNDPLAARR
ncbi:MAG: hypothetical protein ABJG95_05615 [Rhizobiaceae bacterium]